MRAIAAPSENASGLVGEAQHRTAPSGPMRPASSSRVSAEPVGAQRLVTPGFNAGSQRLTPSRSRELDNVLEDDPPLRGTRRPRAPAGAGLEPDAEAADGTGLPPTRPRWAGAPRRSNDVAESIGRATRSGSGTAWCTQPSHVFLMHPRPTSLRPRPKKTANSAPSPRAPLIQRIRRAQGVKTATRSRPRLG